MRDGQAGGSGVPARHRVHLRRADARQLAEVHVQGIVPGGDAGVLGSGGIGQIGVPTCSLGGAVEEQFGAARPGQSVHGLAVVERDVVQEEGIRGGADRHHLASHQSQGHQDGHGQAGQPGDGPAAFGEQRGQDGDQDGREGQDDGRIRHREAGGAQAAGIGGRVVGQRKAAAAADRVDMDLYPQALIGARVEGLR